MVVRAEDAVRPRRGRPEGGRRPGRPSRAVRLLASLVAFVAPILAPAAAQAARLVSAQGSQAAGYGRIVLTFDVPVAVKARVSGTILTLAYGESVAAGPERLAAALPDYVGVVRRDPDGTALRLALSRVYRANVQEAGEQVFIDLLPETWTGLAPQLPPEVVAELARRARVAEAALRARNPAPVPRPLALDVSSSQGRTRLSLRLPPEAQTQFDDTPEGARLTVTGAWRVDERGARGRLRPEAGRYRVESDAAGVRLTVQPAEGFAAETARDGEEAVIDLVAKAKPKAAEASPPVESPPAAKVPPSEAAKGVSEPEAGSVAKAEPRAREPIKEAAKEPVARRAGSGLVFPFAKPVPAALFERGGLATVVFETGEAVTVPPPGGTGLVARGAPERVGAFTVLRFAVPEGRLVDLVPVSEPRGWELTAGDDLAPSESLTVRRVAGGQDRVGVGVGLPEAGGAVWLDQDDERIAVVTAGGTRRAGVVKPQRFVDFELLPSRVGVAVLALADDLAVRPDLDGVAIGRERGVSVSGVARAAELPVAEAGDLAIDRTTWEAARRGDTGTMLRQMFAEAVEASRAQRGPARLALARAMMANGLDAEAVGALGAAASEDPVIDGEAQTELLRGILSARLGRAAEAERILSAERFARNPEARLWRGYAAALAGRWSEADAGIHAGEALLERYPEDLAAVLLAAGAEASVELGDWDTAVTRSRAAIHGADALTRDRMSLVRARIDEAKGASVPALEVYESLAASAERPVAAAADLRAALLAQSLGRLTVPEAIERLERLALFWHGGATECDTLAALGRLYAEAGRWRQVFVTARRVDGIAPDAVTTRALHERAQALFEDLFLGERSAKLGGVEGLALYFDFKDFAPAGRRADEIVRRLADRLVALDLLDSADELLRYQIENRLTGPARSSVAARLATIRLMEGKPLDALKVLEETHLPALPEDLRRARALLRARALSDLSRTDLALETIQDETGPDIDRLRADILWSARRWREAGEAHEALLGTVWRSGKPLDEAARNDVLRAAIAYGLAGEALGLERLKAKFAAPMAVSPDARTFALLIRPDAPRSPAFREAASRATAAQTLGAFLAEYRRRYPEVAVPERGSDDAAPRAEADAAPPRG